MKFKKVEPSDVDPPQTRRWWNYREKAIKFRMTLAYSAMAGYSEVYCRASDVYRLYRKLNKEEQEYARRCDLVIYPDCMKEFEHKYCKRYAMPKEGTKKAVAC